MSGKYPSLQASSHSPHIHMLGPPHLGFSIFNILTCERQKDYPNLIGLWLELHKTGIEGWWQVTDNKITKNIAVTLSHSGLSAFILIFLIHKSDIRVSTHHGSDHISYRSNPCKIRQSERSWTQRPHTVWLHLYIILEKSLRMENRFVGAGSGWGGEGSDSRWTQGNLWSYRDFLYLDLVIVTWLCFKTHRTGHENGCISLNTNCCCSVAPSCPTLCNHEDYSTPGLPVLHHLLEFVQTHVHWVRDAIQPSHPLSSPFPPALNLSQHQNLFLF